MKNRIESPSSQSAINRQRIQFVVDFQELADKENDAYASKLAERARHRILLDGMRDDVIERAYYSLIGVRIVRKAARP